MDENKNDFFFKSEAQAVLSGLIGTLMKSLNQL